MPDTILGLPFYLAIAIASFLIVILIGLLRGGLRSGGGDRAVPKSAAQSPLQTLAAIVGILSFVMQVLQWLKLI
jgi:hypothetical protein